MQIDTEQMNAMVQDYFPGAVGVRFTDIKPGHTECRLAVETRHHNPGGVLHGGVPYTLADTAMAIAIVGDLEPDQHCATIEIKMTYLKAVTEGELICTANVIKKGRRIVLAEAEVRNGSEPIAKATGSFYIVKPDA